MRVVTVLLASALTLGLLLPAVAARRNPYAYRPYRLDDRPKLRDADRLKRGQLPPGREGRWNPEFWGQPLLVAPEETGRYAPPEELWQAWPSAPAPGGLATTSPPTQPGAEVGPAPVYPIITWNDVVYVSTRDYFNALGATAYWDAARNSAVVTLPDRRTVTLPLALNVIQVDGKPVVMAQPTATANGVMMVPLMALSEALGVTAKWDAANQTFTLETKAAPAEVTAGTEEQRSEQAAEPAAAEPPAEEPATQPTEAAPKGQPPEE